MALPRKKKDGFALLLGEPEEKPGDPLDDEEPDDDLDDLSDEDLPEDDAMSLEGDAGMDDMMGVESSIDPEQAALCETLGFTDPKQQQALIDLVKLVNSPTDPMAAESTSPLPPLPESSY